MEIADVFALQDQAATSNVLMFPEQFQWSDIAIGIMIDTHVFLGNDPEIATFRKGMRDTATAAFEGMNVVVNLVYDSAGSLLSALRLMRYGVLADAWSLMRGAFESTCYSEFFSLSKASVKDYVQIAERIKRNRSANVVQDYQSAGLQIWKIRKFLQTKDGENRDDFYARLSNFGTHASPVRSGLRIRLAEPEVRMYLSIGHRELHQCLADFAATAKYTAGIPFDAWPDLMGKNAALVARYTALEQRYEELFAL